ncbi:MAG: cytochrome C oxidase subunit I, partial [Proteobacteria bacterium]|nr:cytochrome C oxidase subunit I [Pseudomonadota bacterium]
FAVLSSQLEDVGIVKSTLAISVPIALIMVASLLVSLFIFALGSTGEREMIFFERLFWIPGHIQQVLNGVLLIAVWYALKGAIGLKCRGFRYMGFFNWMLFTSALILFAIPFVFDPIARDAKVISEIIYAVGLGVPIFAHGVNILKGLKRNGNKVQFISLILSMAIYFFGIAIAYSGFGNDLRVPAHYHGAVTGLTLAMMGLSHHYLAGVKIKGFVKRLGELQPAVYGIGMILVISGLMVSGIFGAPRKTYGVSFATEPAVLIALTVMGIGTLLAVAGGVLFVLYSSVSLIKGERNDVRY